MVPAAPVYNLEQTFNDPQIRHREMRIEMDQPLAKDGKVKARDAYMKASDKPRFEPLLEAGSETA